MSRLNFKDALRYWIGFLGFVALLNAIFILCFPGKSQAQDVLTYIPKNAVAMLPVVQAQQNEIFPENPIPGYMGALIEQESCVGLTNSRCWGATSELKTSREEGAGLFQITRAYSSSGKLRFDTLADLKKKYPEELQELDWADIYQRPDLQIRAGLLLVKDNYDALEDVPDTFNRMAMTDSAYNGGIGNLSKSRRACGMTKGCDPDVWFDNVETTLVQSTVEIYGTSSARSINTEHVKEDMSVRLWKYRPYLY